MLNTCISFQKETFVCSPAKVWNSKEARLVTMVSGDWLFVKEDMTWSSKPPQRPLKSPAGMWCSYWCLKLSFQRHSFWMRYLVFILLTEPCSLRTRCMMIICKWEVWSFGTESEVIWIFVFTVTIWVILGIPTPRRTESRASLNNFQSPRPLLPLVGHKQCLRLQMEDQRTSGSKGFWGCLWNLESPGSSV